ADAGYPRRGAMLPVVLIAMFMAGFDIWGGNVAAPSLQRGLHGGDAGLQLVVGGYAFILATGKITGGRVRRLFRFRRAVPDRGAELRRGIAAVRRVPVAGRARRLPAGAGADGRGDGPAGGGPHHGLVSGA